MAALHTTPLRTLATLMALALAESLVRCTYGLTGDADVDYENRVLAYCDTCHILTGGR